MKINNDSKALKVAVIGANGYSGKELVRLLLNHSQLKKLRLSSRQEEKKPIQKLFPAFNAALLAQLAQHAINIVPEFLHPQDEALYDSDVVFFATPNGTALKEARRFLDKGCVVIDLSADFRLKDRAVYKKWYGEHDAPDLLAEAVYGLPELYRSAIQKARLIANPGCYATATQLALAPLLKNGWIEAAPIIADAKSGVSGAGKKVEEGLMFAEVNESFSAYAIHGHRHHPEIVQNLQPLSPSAPLDLVFTPHLVPMQRGIFVSIYARKTALAATLGDDALRQGFNQYYANEPFITVLPENTWPRTADSVHRNVCQLAVFSRPDSQMLSVFSTLDNMVKGAAGQAVQNMNLVMNYAQTDGLL